MQDGWAGIIGAGIGSLGTLVVTFYPQWRSEREKDKDRSSEEERWMKQREADEGRWHAERKAEEERWERERRYEREQSRRQDWAEDRKRVYMKAATAALRWRELLTSGVVRRRLLEETDESFSHDQELSDRLDEELTSALGELSIIAARDLREAGLELSLALTIADSHVGLPEAFDLHAAEAAVADLGTPYSKFIILVRRDLGIVDSRDSEELGRYMKPKTKDAPPDGD